MGKYDILVLDAEHNLELAKRKKKLLSEKLDKAFLKWEDAEIKVNEISENIIKQESVIRSLAQKLVQAKAVNKKFK